MAVRSRSLWIIGLCAIGGCFVCEAASDAVHPEVSDLESVSKCMRGRDPVEGGCMSLVQSATHRAKVLVQDSDVEQSLKDGNSLLPEATREHSPDEGSSFNDLGRVGLRFAPADSTRANSVSWVQRLVSNSATIMHKRAERLLNKDFGGGVSVLLVVLGCFIMCGLAYFFHMEMSKGSAEEELGLAGKFSHPTASRGAGTSRDVLMTQQRTPLMPSKRRTEPSPMPSLAAIPRFGASIGPPQSQQNIGVSPRLSGNPDSADTGQYFCHDLVVPQFCECMLIVPTGPLNSDESFDVTDVNGSVVLQVAVRSSPLPSGSAAPSLAQNARKRIVVSTAQNDLLATCSIAQTPQTLRPGGEDALEFQLLRSGGDYFAGLRSERQGDRYLLTTVHGMRLHLWGTFEHFAVNITDDSAKLLATTEMCQVDFDPSRNGFYRLRLAPLTDVGLVLCSLLCIQHIEGRPFGAAENLSRRL